MYIFGQSPSQRQRSHDCPSILSSLYSPSAPKRLLAPHFFWPHHHHHHFRGLAVPKPKLVIQTIEWYFLFNHDLPYPAEVFLVSWIFLWGFVH